MKKDRKKRKKLHKEEKEVAKKEKEKVEKEVAKQEKDQFMLLLKLTGSALIPYHVQFGRSVNLPINDGSIVSPFPLPMFRIFISLQNFVSVLEN